MNQNKPLYGCFSTNPTLAAEGRLACLSYLFSWCDHPSHEKYLPFAADEGHYHYKALSSGLLQLQDMCPTVENDWGGFSLHSQKTC